MELYHVLNRGVDKRTIFLDNSDRRRFTDALYFFNDIRPIENTRHLLQNTDLRSRYKREPLVDIHGWCMMNNHYHLLISEHKESGLTRFIRKLNIGYAKYFNERHNRSGTLFQGRTKKVRITSDAHFHYILHYIHLNPLDFLNNTKLWREGKIRNAKQALQHLDSYRWSSYLDYADKTNFPDLLTTKLFKDERVKYSKTLSDYLTDIELDTVKSLLLE